MTARNRPVCVFLALFALGACATTPPAPRIVTKTVQVAVPVACTPDIGAAPAYPDTDAALEAAPDVYQRVKLLVAGRLERIAREVQLAAALGACEGGGA
jgi:hypothetical protein